MKKIKTALLLLFFILLSFNLIKAQDSSIDLSVTPNNFYIHSDYQPSATQEITLKNESKTDLKITPQLFEFKANNYDGRPEIKKKSNFQGLIFNDETIRLNQSFNLQPNQEKKIYFYINSSEANLSELNLSLLFIAESGNQAFENFSGAKITGGVGVNIIVLSALEKKDYSKLSLNFKKLPKFIDSFSGRQVEIFAKNSGQSGTLIKGNLKIINFFSKKEIYSTEFQPDLILAQSQRKIRFQQDDEVKEFLQIPRFLFGKYQVQVNLSSGHHLAGSDLEIKNFEFYALPIILIEIIFGVIFSLIFLKLILFNLIALLKKIRSTGNK